MTNEEWALRYQNRTERLAQFIALKAPEVIIETECRMVLEATAKGKPIRKWIGYKLRYGNYPWRLIDKLFLGK